MIQIPKKLCNMSEYLRGLNMLDGENLSKIPEDQFERTTIENMVNSSKYADPLAFLKSKTFEELVEMMRAADFYGMDPLLKNIASVIANLFKGKSSKQLCKEFDLVNDTYDII